MSIDPTTFLQTGNPSYFNRYAYTLNDPINLIDPDGQQARRPPNIRRGRQNFASVGTQLRFDAAMRRNTELGNELFGEGTPRISPRFEGNIGNRQIRQLERSNDVLARQIRNRDSETMEGSSGGPGEGKRFPAEGREIRESMEGVPCTFCGRRTTNESGRPNSRERDHSDAKSRGGNNSAGNENQSCRTCNRSKGPLEGQTFRERMEERFGSR